MTNQLNEKQKSALQELVHRLNVNNISFVVIGGLAAIAYGVKRDLVDIDIQVGKSDFQKVEDVFNEEVKVSARHYITDRWDINQMIITLNSTDIDICQAEDFYYKMNGESFLLPNTIGTALSKEVDGIEFPTLPLDLLIRYKKAIARPVDNEDLSLLTQLR